MYIYIYIIIIIICQLERRNKCRKRTSKANAKGRKVNRRWNAKGWISAKVGLLATVWILVTKMGLSVTVFVLVWVRNCREWLSASVSKAVANGSQRLGLGLGSDCRKWFCRSSREWFATIGFAFGFRPSRMVLPEPSRMVRNDWVRTVANGFARVVTNGSQRLGWVWVRTVANGFARDVANGSQRLGIGDGVGSYR